VYALILPLILLVPKELIAPRMASQNPQVEAEVLDEIAGNRAGITPPFLGHEATFSRGD